jgi:hypothetical protein
MNVGHLEQPNWYFRRSFKAGTKDLEGWYYYSCLSNIEEIGAPSWRWKHALCQEFLRGEGSFLSLEHNTMKQSA